MNETIRHRLPLLASGQAQKEVTHNEAVLAIDRQLHAAVSSITATAPPATLVAGEAYIVPRSATGTWAGNDDMVASYDGFGWVFTAPVTGCLVWIADQTCFAVFDGLAWRADWPVSGLAIGGRRVLAESPIFVTVPVDGIVIDIEARTAIAQLISALHDQGITL